MGGVKDLSYELSQCILSFLDFNSLGPHTPLLVEMNSHDRFALDRNALVALLLPAHRIPAIDTALIPPGTIRILCELPGTRATPARFNVVDFGDGNRPVVYT